MKHTILACLVLLISAVLSQTTDSQKVSAHLVVESSSVPLDQIYDKSTQEYMKKATVSVQFGAHSLTLDLELAPHFVHEDFKIVNVDEHGVETEVEHDLDQHCVYEGTVENNPLTKALLIACDGQLRGTIQTGYTSHNLVVVDGVTYAESSASQTQSLPVEAVPLPDHFVSDSSVLTARRSLSQARGEIGVVLYIQPTLVTKIRSWKWTTDDYARLTITRCNFLYNKVGLQVRLLSVKLITEKFTDPSADTILDQFTKWFSTGGQPRTEDYSFLMTGAPILSKTGGRLGGLAWVRSMCSNLGTGISSIDRNDPLNWGHLLSHEMGHSIGALDDYSRRDTCCPNTLCVMDVSGNTEEKWSDCTAKEIAAFFSQPKTCLGANNCVFGAWGAWSTRCTGGFQFRTQAVTSGPCQPFAEFRPAPICTAPTAPRAGVFAATPNLLQMWACDPNVNGMVPVTVKNSAGVTIGSSTWADNFKGWDKWRDECVAGMQHTYEIKLNPPPASGSRLTITIGGIDAANKPDNLGLTLPAVVGSGQLATAVSEEDEIAPLSLEADGVQMPTESNGDSEALALTPGAIVAIVLGVVIVVAIAGLAGFTIKKGIDRNSADNGHSLLGPERL